MKLRVLSEIQYKETTTSMDRSNSTGVRAQGSVNDLLHTRPQLKPTSKTKRKPKDASPS